MYEISGRLTFVEQRVQHSQEIDIHAPAGFDPTISAGERPQTYTLDRAATGTSELVHLERIIYSEVHTAVIFM
jgi:hypothetical protein